MTLGQVDCARDGERMAIKHVSATAIVQPDRIRMIFMTASSDMSFDDFSAAVGDRPPDASTGNCPEARAEPVSDERPTTGAYQSGHLGGLSIGYE